MPQLSNFTLYFNSNCPRKSKPKFRLKMNSRWSNCKLKGQMVMKFYELDIEGKLMKKKLKPKSYNLDLRSGINPCFKISKNPHSNLGKKMKILISKLKLPIQI